jgi:23S rRNA pseudouridine1911/1915/1917 synthase
MHNHDLTAIVPPERNGYRLDQVLAYLFPHYSRTYLQRQIQCRNVQVNSQAVEKSSLRTFSGQRIQIQPILECIQTTWEGDGSIALSIIDEDEALLIINKPAGLVTHPAPGHPDHTLVNALLHHTPSLAQLPRAGIIHRLDKDTSGLLVIPKTLPIHTYLVRELATHKIERGYQAIVKGQFTTGGIIDLPIGRHPTLRQKQAVIPQGKPAVTHYHILERFSHHTLLGVKLETGRTHQIRVHMAHINHAIVGDPVYGNRTTHKTIPCLRQALHAHTLSVHHPLTHQRCTWEAPIPEDIQQLIARLREGTYQIKSPHRGGIP